MISIIIPTRNEEKILEKTLLNFKNGFTLPHEVIVSDGKSTDATLAIARKYADQVIEADPTKKQNIAVGRNTGAAAAKGDFLVFFDADCSILEPDKFFSLALKQFEKPTISGLVTNIRVLKEHETKSDKIIMGIINWWYGVLNNVFHIGMAGGEFQMMRRETFKKIGGYNEHLVASEDVYMMAQLNKFGQTKLDRSLTVYHTGRRAHQVGWPKLLWQWFSNTVSMTFRGKAASGEWEVIR